MYYSIVYTYHIHCSDTYAHVYARWVGFQMWRRKPERRASKHINANLKNHTYDGQMLRASTEVQCCHRIIQRDIHRDLGRTIMMVVLLG
jgi:hypothetical protein